MRDFLNGLALGAAIFSGVALAAEPSLKTFEEAAAAAGWEATSPGSFYFVQATDLHVNDTGPLVMENKYEGKSFVDDINTLSPQPRFLAVTGDTVSDTFRSPSSWPKAEKGFQAAKDRLFAKLAVPYHLVLGNNGCSPEAFHKVWPELPTHWSFDCEGIHFVGLYGYALWKPENSNHAGALLDQEQLEWLKKDVAAAAQSKTLVIFTHEPLQDPDCHLLRAQLAPLVGGFSGDVWNIAGHNHMNSCDAFNLAGKTVRVLQTTSPVGAWKPGKGAYRIVFASAGRIVGTALRWGDKSGEPVGFEKDRRPEEIRMVKTIDDVFGSAALRTVMVGAEDKPMRVASDKVEDRISNLRITKGGAVVYKIPLDGLGGKTRQIAILAPPATLVELSDDGNAWRPVELRKSDLKDALVCEVPPELAAIQFLYIKMKAPAEKEVRLYGIGLLPGTTGK